MERYQRYFSEDIEYEIDGIVYISPDLIENGETYYYVDDDLDVYYDEEEDEFYYYEDEFDDEFDDEDEVEFEESFTQDKPPTESGYEVKKVRKKIDGKVVIGWEKRKKAGSTKKKSKLSRGALKRRAKKAAKSKKAKGSSYQRKISKKAKKTRALNK